MSGQLWLITDQLPYPPRNGVTLPVFRYAQALAEQQSLRLVLLADEAAVPLAEQWRANEALFGPITACVLRRQPVLSRLMSELRGREMFQHGFEPATSSAPPPPLGPEDRLLVAPISAVAKLRALGVPPPARAAALVSDCTAGEYHYRMLERTTDWRGRLKGHIDRWRSRGIGRIEARLLEPYAHVLLQTPRDREIYAELVGASAARRATLLPNGVDESLYELPLRTAGRDVVFMAELSGEYGPIALWLASQVWPRVRRRGHRLRVIGRGANAELLEAMAAAPDLVHEEYVPGLADVYRNSSVAISPVFKGFGLINKTLDAMAAGAAVVGGLAAFNGIEGFEPGVHGYVCERPLASEFITALDNLLADPVQCERLGRAGRALLGRTYSWVESSDRLVRLLQSPVFP